MSESKQRNLRAFRRPATLLCLLVVGLALALAAFGCGGSSNGKAETVIEKFLEIGQSPGTTNQFLLDQLPSDMPDGVPEYPGSNLIGSTVSTGTGLRALGVLRETTDPLDKVYLYYESALDNAPWSITVSSSQGKTAALQFTNANDATLTGAVVIQPSGDGGHTTIFFSIQTSSSDVTSEPFKLEPTKPLPRDWPQQVPLYLNATITDTGWGRNGDATEWQITFLAKTAPLDILAFYRTELTAKNWAITDKPAQGGVSGFTAEVKEPGQTWDFSIAVSTFAKDPTYAQAMLQLNIGPPTTPTAQPPATTPTP